MHLQNSSFYSKSGRHALVFIKFFEFEFSPKKDSWKTPFVVRCTEYIMCARKYATFLFLLTVFAVALKLFLNKK